jgi:hypothetical protein
MLFSLAIFTTIIISEICKFFYPKSLEEIMQIGEDLFNEIQSTINHCFIIISYNAIYYFSCCQIYYNKVNTHINYLCALISPYLGLSTNKNALPEFTIKIYKNGDLEETITLYNPHNNINIAEHLDNYDDYDDSHLIVMMDDKQNIKCFNKTHNEESPINITFNLSNLKFIAFQLYYNENTYPIHLKSEMENYYVVDNVLNRDFFKYYIKNILELFINNDTFDYKLIIIDNNANLVELSSSQALIIGETDYEIKE